MAKNELVSLGLIYHKPMHVYAINALIKKMGLEHWAHISQASIYNALNRLEKEGCVDINIERVGNMPERKVYEVTIKGCSRLYMELKKAILECEPHNYLFHIALSFLFTMPTKEAIAFTEQRIDKLTEILNIIQEKKLGFKKDDILNGLISITAAKEHIDCELRAAKSFISLLKSNPTYYTKLGEKIKQYEI